MKRPYVILISAALVIAFVTGCQSKQSASSTSDDEQLNEFKKEVERVYPDLKSPGEISLLIELTGADYVPALVADTADAPMYIGNPDAAALNLGIYTSDIAYTTTYKQTSQSVATLKAAQSLANDLGIGFTYLSSMMSYYSEEVAGKEDTLITILEEGAGKLNEDLTNSDKQRLYTAFVTGFTIENLYLASGIIKTYPEDLLPDDAKALILREMILVILESERNINELITMVDEVLTEDDPGVLLDELKDLKASFDLVDLNAIAGLQNPGEILTNEGLNTIIEKVTTLREEIVNAG